MVDDVETRQDKQNPNLSVIIKEMKEQSQEEDKTALILKQERKLKQMKTEIEAVRSIQVLNESQIYY